jgi:predicted transglutaminase-like cysteine proteinase
MLKLTSAVISIVLSCTYANANALHLNPTQNKHNYNMDTFGETSVPFGYFEYCKTTENACKPEATPATIPLDRAAWDKIIDINNYVNEKIVPKTDEEIYGVPEKWVVPEIVGDCEDYVLLKKKMLTEQGLPDGALLVTVGRDADGGGHAVLTVVTDRGDFILDNQEQKVLLWRDSEIYFLKRQAPHNPNRWESLGRG